MNTPTKSSTQAWGILNITLTFLVGAAAAYVALEGEWFATTCFAAAAVCLVIANRSTIGTAYHVGQMTAYLETKDELDRIEEDLRIVKGQLDWRHHS